MNSNTKQFCKILSSLEYRHSRWQVWVDFLEMAALSIACSVYRNNDLEAEYMAVITRYEPKEQKLFPRLFGEVVDNLYLGDGHYCDFLGTCFHELEMHQSSKGQFFTPYNVSLMMAKMSLTDLSSRSGIITVDEPACGSGGMIIACCEVARKSGVDFQRSMFFRATDVDRTCFHMAYIQLSLIAAPAAVVLGDTLRMKFSRKLMTPQYFMAGMSYEKLFRDSTKEQVPLKVVKQQPQESTNITGEQLSLFG